MIRALGLLALMTSRWPLRIAFVLFLVLVAIGTARGQCYYGPPVPDSSGRPSYPLVCLNPTPQINLTSTGTPALSGVYNADQAAQFAIVAEMTSIIANGVFTDGQPAKAWFDASGQPHVFTVAQFKTFATAVAAYIDAYQLAQAEINAGQNVSLPDPNVTIP